jgi:hypothetical protein
MPPAPVFMVACAQSAGRRPLPPVVNGMTGKVCGSVAPCWHEIRSRKAPVATACPGCLALLPSCFRAVAVSAMLAAPVAAILHNGLPVQASMPAVPGRMHLRKAGRRNGTLLPPLLPAILSACMRQ